MSSTKYQNIPHDHLENGLVQEYDENQISSSITSYNNNKYDSLEQDDDSDTFVYKDGRNELSPTENKILEEIEGEEIINYDEDDQIELIQHSLDKNDELVEINIKETEKSSIFGSTFNFTNSIIGAGVIGMPLAMKEAGLISGITLLVLLTLLVDWTVGVLIKDSKLSGQKTYQGLMYFCYGKFGFLIISIFQFIFAYGGMCAYSIIVGDTISTVLAQYISPTFFAYSILTSRNFIICLTTFLIILPLSLNRDISKLSKTSFLSLLGIMIITISVIYEGIKVPKELKGDPNQRITFIHKDIFQCIGVISFAFVCHHNSLLILGSLKKPSMNRFATVTHLSTGWSFLVSIAIALGGYLVFTDKTKGNILNNFPQDSHLINISRILFAFNMFLTSPLECFVCREVILNLLNPNSVIGGGENLNSKETKENKLFGDIEHFIVTLILVLCSLYIALTIDDLGFVLEITGGFSATMLAYILPTCCYCKLTKGSLKSKKKLPYISCMIFGFIVMIISTILSIYNFLKPKKS
ncbi:hypothetical protein BCR36DRAFT_412780 [Piromyces finnis]|uniref:Amino acid transporter transmembrane domain-containing protein n=1 Tax=Piromyces finnis TaxID=1754191 RepID=A0A1Y1V7P7_9FUNG|nr:hypothetical protein BCR36DRAFT_412780 [Piromyces finnis]|eukprot:ORX49259.1 hypothetical protein BCR36DRAFT_412780 [Piromyces finnis]